MQIHMYIIFFFPQIVLVHGASLNLQQTWGVRRQLLLTENFCSDKQLRSSKHKLRNSPQQVSKSPECWPSGWGWCCPNAARSAYIRILQLHHPDYSSFMGFFFRCLIIRCQFTSGFSISENLNNSLMQTACPVSRGWRLAEVNCLTSD